MNDERFRQARNRWLSDRNFVRCTFHPLLERAPRAAVVFRGRGQRKDGPRFANRSRAQTVALTPCRWSVCRAILAGRPAIFWTTEYRPPSVTSWSISGFSWSTAMAKRVE